MEYNSEIQLVLNSLSKERKELTDKVAEIDKIIKRIKYGNLNFGLNKGKVLDDDINVIPEIQADKPFPLKVQVIKVLDILGKQAQTNTRD